MPGQIGAQKGGGRLDLGRILHWNCILSSSFLRACIGMGPFSPSVLGPRLTRTPLFFSLLPGRNHHIPVPQPVSPHLIIAFAPPMQRNNRGLCPVAPRTLTSGSARTIRSMERRRRRIRRCMRWSRWITSQQTRFTHSLATLSTFLSLSTSQLGQVIVEISNC